jgi:hypothetical protein
MKRQAPHTTQQPQLQPPQPAQALQALQPPRAQPLQPPQALQPLTTALQPPQRLTTTAAYCWPRTSISLSKTKNVLKLTSKISSSSKLNCGVVSRKCISEVGPTPPVADAPPAIAMETPTTPATGTVFFRGFFRCFGFVRGIVETSHAFWYATKALSPTAPFVLSLARVPCKNCFAYRTGHAGHRGALSGHLRGVDHKRRYVQLSSAMSLKPPSGAIDFAGAPW